MGRIVFTPEKWKRCNKVNKRLMEDFMVELRSNKKSIHTIDQYRYDLRMVICYILDNMDNMSFLDMKKKDFRRIKMWLIEERGVSSARCSRVMSAIHSMLDYAEDEEEYNYEYNVSKKVKGLSKEPVREIVFLSDERIKKLRNALKEREMYKYMALVDMLYDSAARRREIHQVLRNGLLERNYTNVVRGKGGKQFPLLYFSRSHESLGLYLSTRKDKLNDLWIIGSGDTARPASYESIYGWVVSMRSILEEVEGEYIHFTPHSFRHSSLENMKRGTHYICRELCKEEGFSLEQLKVFAHHEDSGTTESYLKRDDNNILQEMFGIKMN